MPSIYSLAWDYPLEHGQPTLTTFLKNAGCQSPCSHSLSVAPQLGVEAHVPSSIQAGMAIGLFLHRSCVGSHGSWKSTLLCPEETALLLPDHCSYSRLTLSWWFLCFGRTSCNTDVSFMTTHSTDTCSLHLGQLWAYVSSTPLRCFSNWPWKLH